MTHFFDSKGNSIKLGREIGRGGEGTVFEINDQPQLVAKIYHEPPAPEKAEKLRQMVALGDEKLLKLAAWVTEVLYRDEKRERVAGFLMPRLSSGAQIHELYNPASRRRRFPDADWRFLIRAAANAARAFAVVHAHGHAIGDVNHGNIVIARDATVRLIDCDSYHINSPEQKFLCEVGVSTHTPPELQGKSLREIERTGNHDNFGLAVLIFQLLFMGRHPFSGKFLGAGENTLENSIRLLRFAYGDDAAAREMQPPPGTLPLAAVSAPIAELFRRAFLNVENRPSPREWIETLEKLEENLAQCKLNSSHFYFNESKDCQWCRLEVETGVLFFPTHFNENAALDPNVDLVTIGRIIDLIKPPDVPAQLPDVSAVTANSQLAPRALSSNVALASRDFNEKLIGFLVCLSLAIIFLVVAFGFQILIISAGIFFAGQNFIEWLTKKAKNEAQAALGLAQSDWEDFKQEWRNKASREIFTNAQNDLKQVVAEYQNLPAARDAKFLEIENELRRRQLNFYLKGFPISRAKIGNLTEAQIKELNRAQIISADDVLEANFRRLPYFSPQMKKRLLGWRTELERNFNFRLTPQMRQQHFDDVEADFAEKQADLEKRIRGGVPQLQQLSQQISTNYQKLADRLDSYSTELFAAERAVEYVSDLKSKAAAWAIGVTAASLIISFPIRYAILNINEPPPGNSSAQIRSYQKAPEIVESVRNSDKSNALSGNPAYSSQTRFFLEDGTPISKENWGKAFDYYLNGVNQVTAADYEKAVKSFQNAIELKPEVSELRIRLGEAYFLDGKYSLAVIAFNDALKINPQNALAHYQLGNSYNKLLRRTDAINSFKNAIKANPNDGNAFYELGTTLRADKKPNEAINHLIEAIKLMPTYNEARYELALCYDEVGFKDLALRELEKLQNTDSDLAEELAQKLKAVSALNKFQSKDKM